MTKTQEMLTISRVVCGDSKSFEALVVDNQKVVYNLALRMTGNEHDAMDISQEAFMKAYTSLETYRGDCRFSVWLYRITYNVCIDFIRKQQKNQTSPIIYANSEDDFKELEIPDNRYAPENELEKKELSNSLRAAVSSLSPEHREIFTMREYSGFSYAAISDALGISEGTVKSRLSRAKHKLAEILIKNGTFSPSVRQTSRKEDADI